MYYRTGVDGGLFHILNIAICFVQSLAQERFCGKVIPPKLPAAAVVNDLLSPTTGTPKQLRVSAALSHLWLGDLVELKHLATGDLVELNHLTKDIYLGTFSDNM